MADDSTKNTADPNSMTIWEHLDELRRRLQWILIAFIIGLGIGILFYQDIYSIFNHQFDVLIAKRDPLFQIISETLSQRGYQIVTDLKANFLTVQGGFSLIMKLGIMSGMIFAFPMILFQILSFVFPGLYANEKRAVIMVTPAVLGLFIIGVMFSYLVVTPSTFGFFMSINESFDDINFIPDVNKYLTLSIQLLIAVGLTFEIPVVITALAKMGIVTASFLRRKRKHIYFGLLLIGAFITADPISMLMLCVPLFIMFEISILLAVSFGKREEELMDLEELETKT